ncbi:MAG: hypothetical protein ABSH05_26390 [Bryobacteraceae bacterium]
MYQIARAEISTGLRKATVRVEKRLDGTVAVRFRDRYLNIVLCEPRAKAVSAMPAKTAARRKPGGRYHDWNENFDLHQAPPIWVASQASGTRKDSEW